MLKLGCVDILQFLLILNCALRAHVRRKHFTNALLHYICYITLICCGEHNDLSLIPASSSSSNEYNLPRLIAANISDSPSTGLRHPSFGGRCRKAVLGVCKYLSSPMSVCFACFVRNPLDLRFVIMCSVTGRHFDTLMVYCCR